jgi:hypothetical protein
VTGSKTSMNTTLPIRMPITVMKTKVVTRAAPGRHRGEPFYSAAPMGMPITRHRPRVFNIF